MKPLFLSILWLLSFQLHAATVITGKIVGVADGDTVTLLDTDMRQVKIRLAEIDTPERKQPYCGRAKQALSDLVYGKQADAKVVTIDRYCLSIRSYFDSCQS